MGRFKWLLSLTASTLLSPALLSACADPAEALDPPTLAPPPDPDPPATPIKADDPRPQPVPANGIACDRAGARSCDPDAAPLRCVAGSGGAVWMPADPCAPAHRCVVDYGCQPLPECTDVGLLGCVQQTLFVCEADTDEMLDWTHATDCPAAIPCVNGRGCPNPFGVATPCSFVDPPRCTPDGRVMHCSLEGIDAVWGAPRDCGVGTQCVAGQGCQAPEAHEPDTPTNPPKGQGRGWR